MDDFVDVTIKFFPWKPSDFRKPPPLGVMPKRTWEQCMCGLPRDFRDTLRSLALADAIFRYRAAGFVPPRGWFAEEAEILMRWMRRGTV